MKLQSGVEYVLNNGKRTNELIERDSYSGAVFEGSIRGEKYKLYWYPDGTYCGYDKSCHMSISHPVKFSRRRASL